MNWKNSMGFVISQDNYDMLTINGKALYVSCYEERNFVDLSYQEDSDWEHYYTMQQAVEDLENKLNNKEE